MSVLISFHPDCRLRPSPYAERACVIRRLRAVDREQTEYALQLE